MSKNTKVILGSYFDKFITQKVNSGRFASVSEVICAGLRLLEEREKSLLLNALREGEQSGFSDYSLGVLIQQMDEMKE